MKWVMVWQLNEDLKGNCVEDAVVERYAGNIDILNNKFMSLYH
jgi:hypothetical protein